MNILKHSQNFFRNHWKTLLALLIVLVGGYFYFRSSSVTKAPAVTTKTETVTRGDLRIVVSGSGQVEAVSQVDLTPVIAGDGIDVISVHVQNNQEVKKGQLIAVLDTEDAVRDVQNAQLDLRSAMIKQKQVNDQYKRETKEDLWNRQIQEVTVDQRVNALRQSQEKLRDYSIRAPFDGIVTGLSVEAGDSVSRETVLASVITRNMRVGVSLNEVDAAKVLEGNNVSLSFNALPELMLSGKISRIDTIGKVTQNVVSYDAEVELDEQQVLLKPGMSVSAEIVVMEKHQVLLLPNAALNTFDGKSTAKTLTGNKEITLGMTDEISTEITSGLVAGEKVIVETVTPPNQVGTQSVFSSLFRAPGQNRR